MNYYIALIHKDPDSDYGVSFPDFPGCVTAGSTLEEAAAMAREALEGHVALMIEDGDAIPEPSTMDVVLSDPENREGTPLMVPLTTAAPRKVVRVNITLQEDVLQEIDRSAESLGFTRSGFLAHAARKAIREGV